jgi:hypothetical protein
LRGYFVPNHESLDIHENPSGGRVSMRLGSLWGKGYSKPSRATRPLFSKGGYAVVTTYTDGQVDIGTPHSTKAEAEEAALYAQRMASAESGRTPYKIEVLPVTSVAKNPPLSSHGSSIRIKRTHGLSLPQMRALYKLVKQGNDMGIAYARKKLEVPRSASKSDLLAVVDHHIRDLADR